MKIETLSERILKLSQSEGCKLDKLEEQVKIAEELGMKGVAWSLKKRFTFNTLKSLNYPIVTFADIEKAFDINKETHEIEVSMLSPQDYGFLHYAGLMPRGCLLQINELIKNKICELHDFKVFYPVKKPAMRLVRDPILCVHYLNMDLISNANLTRGEGRSEEPNLIINEDSKMILFKIWQWE